MCNGMVMGWSQHLTSRQENKESRIHLRVCETSARAMTNHKMRTELCLFVLPVLCRIESVRNDKGRSTDNYGTSNGDQRNGEEGQAAALNIACGRSPRCKLMVDRGI